MKKTIFTLALLISAVTASLSQNYFRSGIFLHHSTGIYIWGPNPDGKSTLTVPGQMHAFNISHSYHGNDSVSLDEEWWVPDDNEWSTQHLFFEGKTTNTDISDYLANYKIIVVKSCFPSSEIDSWGQPSDTLDPTYKSVYNYKWHWRHILAVMKNHPENFFVIWTNAPLEINSTTTVQAILAKKFCKWAKDTLAVGNDPEFGAFPPNIYVFDYFNKMSDASGTEYAKYRTTSGDSHPNGSATDFIAPQFVNEIFNAAIAYESVYNGINEEKQMPAVFFPNPTQGNIVFSYKADVFSKIRLVIFNSLGVVIYSTNDEIPATASFSRKLDLSAFGQGIYLYRLTINGENKSGVIINQ